MKPLSGKEFARLLESNGWSLQRINGSHHIYAKAFGGTATVPAASTILFLTSLALFRNHAIGNLVVRRLGNDFLRQKLPLVGVRTVLDNRRRVRVTDAGQRLQLVCRCRVEIDQLRSRGCRAGRLAWGSSLGSLRLLVGRREQRKSSKQKNDQFL